MRRLSPSLSLLILSFTPAVVVAQPWPTTQNTAPLSARIAAPDGFTRAKMEPGSFGAWLRALPVLAGRPQVKLHSGDLKGNQDAHHVVVDIDTGRRDLQQCADAVMRLRAEYQWSIGRKDDVCFRFTSGDPARWRSWRKGIRPRVKGNRVTWGKTAAVDASYRQFRRYLNTVFTYAGTHSLSREMKRVTDPTKVEPGDVFIQGGFPGHAVMVVDVVQNSKGERMFLVAQSYMPAQQIHVLRNPASASPWYSARSAGALHTPEWRFEYTDLRRFSRRGCP